MTPVTQMNKAAYGAIIGNLRQIGRKYYASIPVGMLYVDPAYQRIESRSQTKINKLAANWNPHKMDALQTVAHPDEGVFAVVDGYGRMCACQKLDTPYESIECEVILDAPADPEERRRFEAELFVQQNAETEKISLAQGHTARVLLNDPIACHIDKVCRAHDVKIVYRKGHKPIKTLGSYTDAVRAIRRNGEEGFDFILTTIEKVGFDQEKDGYTCHILRSLDFIYGAYKEQLDDVTEVLVPFLRKMSPQVFKSKSIAAYPIRNIAAALALYLEDYLYEQGIERKFEYHKESGQLTTAA